MINCLKVGKVFTDRFHDSGRECRVHSERRGWLIWERISHNFFKEDFYV